MPVQRYRRVEDMPPVAPLPPGPERARRLRSLWGGWSRVLPPLDLRGVRVYRDLEEATRDREAAVARRCRRLLGERGFEDEPASWRCEPPGPARTREGAGQETGASGRARQKA